MGILEGFTDQITQPIDELALQFEQLSTLHTDANTNLNNYAQGLLLTFTGEGAKAFTDMIQKETSWAYDHIVEPLHLASGTAKTVAQRLREAAQAAEHIFFITDLAQQVLNSLTPELVVREGESAVQAVVHDMRQTFDSMLHDAGSFFSDLSHLNFGNAIGDAENEIKDSVRMARDALAMLDQVGTVLGRWAAEASQWTNWLVNQLVSVVLRVADFLLGYSDIWHDEAVLSHPDATQEEKALAGTDLAFNVITDVAMFAGVGFELRGGDFVFKLGGKEFVKEFENQAVKGILKELEKLMLKDLRAKIIQTIANFFRSNMEKLFINIAAGSLSKKLAVDVLREILGKTEISVVEITDPARRAIYEKLVHDYPGVDSNFIAHLVAAEPGATALSEMQIRSFLKRAQRNGEREYVIELYSHLYNIPGADQMLRDIANKSAGSYKGSLFQMEWIVSHKDLVKAIEVPIAGAHGADIVLKDGTYIELKSNKLILQDGMIGTLSYNGLFIQKDIVGTLEGQVDRYAANFIHADPPLKKMEIIFRTGTDGISPDAFQSIKKTLEAFGREKGISVQVIAWP